MPADAPPWRDLTYPLNVFVHILVHEEGEAPWLHYGLFDRADESLLAAQERSTELLFSRLPPPPARLLEVGIGLATTLHRLTIAGYDVEGITPDATQVAMARARYGEALRIHCTRFEDFRPSSGAPYDAVFFQESSQYIDARRLFEQAATLTSNVIVLDEFALRPLEDPGALHARAPFLDAAEQHGFAISEELDLSARAAPTMRYFADRIPLFRDRLMADLGLTPAHIEELIVSGARYRERYADGTYGYRLLRFERGR